MLDFLKFFVNLYFTDQNHHGPECLNTLHITFKLTENKNGAFIQWSADNVDNNLAILYGKGTFHGLGIVAVVTPSGSFSQLQR